MTDEIQEFEVKWLKGKNNERFFPVTHVKSVRNTEGTNLETLLDEKQDTINENNKLDYAYLKNIPATAQGVQGANGPQGIKGIQGFQGIQGIKGTDGGKGNQGIQGIKGTDGGNGNQGIQGIKGTDGSKGNQGIQGIKGTDGSKGNQGIQGIKGTDGDKGNQGIQGIKGTDGSKGNQGIQGIKGNQGNQGIQGYNGNQGTHGIQGTKGNQGTQGIQGIQGNQGTQGIQGVQGTKGNQGTQGIQGIQGSSAISKVYTLTATGTTDNYTITCSPTFDSTEFTYVTAGNDAKFIMDGTSAHILWPEYNGNELIFEPKETDNLSEEEGLSLFSHAPFKYISQESGEYEYTEKTYCILAYVPAIANKSGSKYSFAIVNISRKIETLDDVEINLPAIYSQTYFTNAVMDYDGNTYDAVILGDQVWMAQNLRTKHYSDGTAIQTANTTSSTVPYYYDYTYSSFTLEQRGLYYNWPAIMNGASASTANPSGVQGVAPAGWHIPSMAEYDQMKTWVGSQSEFILDGYSSYIAKALASTTGWTTSTNNNTPGNNQSANNATGFNAYPVSSHAYGTSTGTDGYDCYLATCSGSDVISTLNLRNLSQITSISNIAKSSHVTVRCVYDGTPKQFITEYIGRNTILVYNGEKWVNDMSKDTMFVYFVNDSGTHITSSKSIKDILDALDAKRNVVGIYSYGIASLVDGYTTCRIKLFSNTSTTRMIAFTAEWVGDSEFGICNIMGSSTYTTGWSADSWQVSNNEFDINTLSNVTIDTNTLQDGQILSYNDGYWVNADPPSSVPVPTVSDAGKFLTVNSSGEYALETVANAEIVHY